MTISRPATINEALERDKLMQERMVNLKKTRDQLMVISDSMLGSPSHKQQTNAMGFICLTLSTMVQEILITNYHEKPS